MAQADAVTRQSERANEMIRQRGSAPNPGNGHDNQAEIEDLKAQLQEAQGIVARQATEHARMKGAHRQQINDYESRLSAMQLELDKARQAPPPNGLPPGVTQAEMDTYGEGLIKVIDKVATERSKEIAPPPPAARQPPADEAQEDPYMDVLRSQIRNFDARNNDPQFVAWLAGTDPAQKRSRNELLQAAFQRQQTRDIAEIFNAYAERREIGAGATTVSPSPDVNGGSPPPPPDNESDIVTPAEIKEHYRNSSFAKGGKGPYVGKAGEKEYQRMEGRIAAAMRDGKVRAPAVG